MKTSRQARTLVVALWLCVAAAATAADQPPTDLRFVGDHWTAWEPPTTMPAGADVYVIEKGDTLWDLAQRFYGDPYLWPQIWERNRYILDAHWIYPGDPLVIGVQPTPIEDVVAATPSGPEGGGDAGRGDEAGAGRGWGMFRGAPRPLGTEDDIYCSGFIGDLDEGFDFTIAGSEYDNLAPTLIPASGPKIVGSYGKVDTVKYELTVGDIVYVDGGEDVGMFPGTVFMVVVPDRRVAHPLTGSVVGRIYKYSGRVRVLSVQETSSIAEIIYTCEPVNVGNLLRPFEPQPVPLGRKSPLRGINDPASLESLEGAPVILDSRAGLVSLGQNEVVFIDRGSNADVTPGDVFTVYRLSTPGLPPVVIGEVAVLSVEPDTAVARIVESRFSIHVGDRLDLKAP